MGKRLKALKGREQVEEKALPGKEEGPAANMPLIYGMCVGMAVGCAIGSALSGFGYTVAAAICAPVCTLAGLGIASAVLRRRR